MMIAVLRQRTVSTPHRQKSVWEGWPGTSFSSGAVEVCVGDDKDSKSSADKTQRARTEEQEGLLVGTVAAEGDRGKKMEKMSLRMSQGL